MSGLLVLGAAQTVPTPGDVDANLADHIRHMEAAARHGVQVLVFPELSLTGYELDRAEMLAFSERDPRLDVLAASAVLHAMTVVVGAPVRLQEGLHIGAFILSPDRSIDVYTKRHLGAFPADANPGGTVPPAEAKIFRPGARNPLIPVGDRTAAVAICADSGRASHPAEAAERRAEIYLASMFVIPQDIERETERLATYAVEHSMAVVFANFGGPSGGLDSAGKSAVWSETGELVALLPGVGSAIVVAARSAAGWRGKTVRL